MRVYTCMWWWGQRPAEDSTPLGAGVAGSCEPRNPGSGKKKSSYRLSQEQPKCPEPGTHLSSPAAEILKLRFVLISRRDVAVGWTEAPRKCPPINFVSMALFLLLKTHSLCRLQLGMLRASEWRIHRSVPHTPECPAWWWWLERGAHTREDRAYPPLF